jgi:UDP-GlcNAc:undecaprenyl-phosphate/decaprenyl-phosphate GlcNAc-1-phosphate transferase
MIIYIICAAVSILFFSIYKKLFLFYGIFDRPDNKRKIHKEPVSLAGSLFLLTNIILYLFFIFFFEEKDYLELFSKKREFFFLIFTILSLFYVGLLDDKFDINPWTKLGATSFILLLLLLADNHLIIKILYFKFENFWIQINLETLSVFFTLICFLGYLNAVNMFDGINLQVGVYSIFVSLYLIYENLFLSLNVILIISLIPYLILNFKNKVFIGNSGVSIIAVIYAYQYLKGYNTGAMNMDKILLLNYLIILDLLRVFTLRVINGSNPFIADQKHVHHLLLEKFKYFKVIIITLLLAILPIYLSIIVNNKWIVLTVFIILYFLLINYLKFSKKSI